MSTLWVVVADQVSARVFAREEPRGALREIEDLVHPAGRLHGRELVTERPGRTFESADASRHAMEPPTDPRRYEAELMARQVAEHLYRGRATNAFAELVLVAGPTVMGLLREALDEGTRRTVSREIVKNLPRADAEELRTLIDRRD